MFALPLDHPLWGRLDDAHRTEDIPGFLRDMAEAWDGERANDLFWNSLCHQSTCYGATYAAIPHLLRIARTDPQAAPDIAGLLGFVAKEAFLFETGDGALPQGLPKTEEAWERKLDVYRDLMEFAHRDGRSPKRYRAILERGPVTAEDLPLIEEIRASFFATLPEIAALCADTYLDTVEDGYRHHHLSGVSAGLGERRLADLLCSGDDGGFVCPRCDLEMEYMIVDGRMACYASGRSEDPVLLDYREGSTARADGFVTPCDDITGEVPLRLAELARAQGDEANLRRLSLFLGSFRCSKCDAEFGLLDT